MITKTRRIAAVGALACLLGGRAASVHAISVPVSTVTAPGGGAYVNSLANITGTVSESPFAAPPPSITGVNLSIKNTATGLCWSGTLFNVPCPSFIPASSVVAASSGTWSFNAATLSLQNGTSYQIMTQSADTTPTNETVLSTTTFTFDSIAPTCVISTPIGPTLSSFPTIAGTAADNVGLSVVQVAISSSPNFSTYWNGSAWVSGVFFLNPTGITSWSYAGVPSGGNLVAGASYQVQCKAIDLAGNQATAINSFVYSPPATVYVSTQNLAPASLGSNVTSQGLLSLGLWTQGGNATFSSLLVSLLGTAPSGNVTAKIYKDANANGIFEPLIDTFLTSLVFGAASPPQANLSFPSQTLTATTQYFFIAVDFSSVTAGKTIGAQIDDSTRFGLFSGASMASQTIYPIASNLANIQLLLSANPSGNYPIPYASPPGGGLDSGIFVNAGQSVQVTAAGTWNTNQYPATDANGVTGVTGLGLNTGALFGSLVGRVGAGNWFALGTNVTFTASAGGELYLAMNDTATVPAPSGSITVTPQVLVSSTVAKVWLGTSAVGINASVAGNWQGGIAPVAGDAVSFDGTVSNKSCNWDISGANLTTLTLQTSYSGVVTIAGPVNPGDYNTLTVTSNVYVNGGTLALGSGNKTLTVQGELLVGTSGGTGTFDMGPSGPNTLQVSKQGIVVSNGGTFRSVGSGNFVIQDVNAFDFFPFTVASNSMANFNVPPGIAGNQTQFINTSGVVFFLNAITLSTVTNVRFTDNQANPNQSIILHTTSKVGATFTGLTFDKFTSVSSNTNVDASDVVAGSTITLLNAAGSRMGSVFDNDPNHVEVWTPDGGGVATASGTLSYPGGAPGTYYIGITTAGSSFNGFTQIVAVTSGAPAYVLSNLTAPSTYYFYGWKTVPAGSPPLPGGHDPRGSFGIPGGFTTSNSVFLGAGANKGGIDIMLQDWAIVNGSVTNISSQLGNIIVRGAVFSATSSTSPFGDKGIILPNYGGNFSLSIPPTGVVPSTVVVQAWVDVDGNSGPPGIGGNGPDSFEASATSGPFSVPPSANLNNVQILIAGGTAPPGGTLSVAAGPANSGFIGDFGAQGVLKLSLTAAGGNVTMNSLRVDVAGAVPTGPSFVIGLWKDTNANGVFDGGPGNVSGYFDQNLFLSTPLAGVSSTTLSLYSPETILSGQTNTYFLSLDLQQNNGHPPLPATGLSVGAANYFGLSAGQMAVQAIYPIISVPNVYTQVMANSPAYSPSGGGFFTNQFIAGGLQVVFTAVGTWQVSPGVLTGPGGLSNTSNLATVAPGVNQGALIASIGGAPWVAVGTGTTLNAPPYGGILSLAMNDFSGGYYNHNGVALVNFSISGSTVGAITGEVDYKGTAGGTNLLVRANQVPPGCPPLTNPNTVSPGCSGTVVSTVTIPMTAGTTFYPYTLAQLPAGPYTVTGKVQGSPGQIGSSVVPIQVVAGSTAAGVNFPLSLGLGQISGVLNYASSYTAVGNYFIGVTTTTAGFESPQGPVFFGTVLQPNQGVFTIPGLQTPNTFYMVAFRDGNGDNEPDGAEPFGLYGNNSVGINDLSSIPTPFSPIFVDTGASVGNININLLDKGAVFGTLTAGVPLNGAPIIVLVGHKNPGDPAYMVENEDFLPFNTLPAGGTLNYTVGLLRPATDYSVLAWADLKFTGNLDPGDPFGVVPATISVPLGGFANANLTLGGPQVPPPVPGFRGAPVPGTINQVQWSWNSVQGATNYFLLDAGNAVKATLGGNATYFVDTIPGPNPGNTLSAIRSIQAANGVAPGPITPSPTGPVATSAATPGAPAVTPSPTSAAVSWAANGNSAGTFYNIQRSTGGATPIFYPIASVNAVSFTDSGLLPSTAYSYQVQAVNVNGSTTPFAGPTAGTTGAATGPSISGAVTYAGNQHGPIWVQAFTDPALTVPAGQVVLPVPSSYYIPVAGPGTYYVRAFVYVVNNGQFAPGEDLGVYQSTGTSPTAITVGGSPVTGVNFAIPVRTLAPGGPYGLTSSVSLNQVSLYWNAPTGMADATPLVGLAGYQVQRATQPLLGMFPQFYNIVSSITFGLNGVWSLLGFADFAPVGGVNNLYRVVAVDYGGHPSVPSSAVAVLPNVGGTINGNLQYFGATPSGIFHVRLAASPVPGAPFIAESATSTPNSFFSFTGLLDGNYFLTVFRDTHTDNLLHDDDPYGTFGGLAQPFSIPIFNGNTVNGANCTVCDRIPITPSSSSYNGALVSTGCPALEQGPGFYTNVYTFRVGGGTPGSVGPGASVQIRMNPSFNSTAANPSPNAQLFLLAPDGSVAAAASGGAQTGGANITYQVFQPGLWSIEPTSFDPGVTGNYSLSLAAGGGGAPGAPGACFNGCGIGKIAGTVSYGGTQQGAGQARLLPNCDTNAFPIAIGTFTFAGAPVATGNYAFSNLPDGVYYVRAFRDSNGNNIYDPNEPLGSFGVSATSCTAVTITGGVASAVSANITLTDPAVGSVGGTILRQGTQTGLIHVEIGQPPQGCNNCNINVVAFATMSAAGSYTLSLIPPATNYTLRAYVDVNGNSYPDPLEAFASSSPVTVNANATTTVSLLVQDPGFGGGGNASISGTISYGGTTTGPVLMGFSTDPNFKTINYLLSQASPGAFAKSGILGGTSYYIAAFIDANNNGEPDYQGSFEEPIGQYGSSFSSMTPVFVPPAGSSSGVVVPILDPSSGSIVGQVTYTGAASGNIVVQAFIPNSNGGGSRGNFQKIVLPRTAGATVYNYTLPYLAASSSFNVSAFVDSNGNGQPDFGEPFGQFGFVSCPPGSPCLGQPVSVSNGLGAFPTYGINFNIQDPGSNSGFGSANSGSVGVFVSYLGTQGGPIIIRAFNNSTYSGTPVGQVSIPAPPGPGDFQGTIAGLPLGTYYVDVFRDAAGTGVLNPTFDAYITAGSVTLDQFNNNRNVNGRSQLVEPGQGGSVNVYSGGFASPGGARFDGGATDIGAGVAVDTVSAGGPYVYVLGVTLQNQGTVASLVKYNSAGVFVASATVGGTRNINPFAVDWSGNVYLLSRVQGMGGVSTGTINKLDRNLNLVQQIQLNTSSPRFLQFNNGFLYLGVEGSNQGMPVTQYNPNTLVALATATFTFPPNCGGSGGCTNTWGEAMAVDPSGNVYVVAQTGSSQGQPLFVLLKFGPNLTGPPAQLDITGLMPGSPNANLAADSLGNVFLAVLPTGDLNAHTYKFNSSLKQVGSASYGPVFNHFNGGLVNLAVGTDNTVYEAWEATTNGGDYLVLRYDNNLNLLATRTFDGLNNTLEDFAFGIAVQDSSNVYVTGGVNNGLNLDWATLRVNMNQSGAASAAGAAGALTIANAISGNLTYGGTLVTSGTVRAVLVPAGSNTPIRLSNAPFAATVPYTFNNVPPGTYNIRAFIDLNNNFQPDPGEPSGQSAAGGFFFGGSTGSVAVNVSLCDRYSITVGQTLSDAHVPSDCTSADSGGAFQRLYTFQGTPGQIVTLEDDAIGFYGSSLRLYDPNGNLVASDNGSAGGGNARIANYKLLSAGLYTVAASPQAPADVGSYTLTMTGTGGSAGSLGAISGNVTYTGVQGGVFLIGLFSTSTFSNAAVLQGTMLPSAGAFAFSGVQTGTTYYIAGFLDVLGTGKPVAGDDIGFYGSTTTGPAPIYLKSGQNFPWANFTIGPSLGALVFSTGEVTGVVTYPNCQNNPTNCLSSLRVEFWASNNFIGQPVAVRTLPGGATVQYDIALPAGSPYFVRAYLDLNGSGALAPGDPVGVYGPGGFGAQPVQPTPGAIQSNITIALKDPGAVTLQGGALSAAGEGKAKISTGTAGAPFLSTTAASAGSLLALNIQLTAGASGLQPGGQIQVIVPPGWPFPQPAATCNAASTPGCIAFSPDATDAKINDPINTLSANGPVATFKISSGTIAAGKISTFTFTASVPCFASQSTSGGGVAGSLSGAQTFTVASAQGSGNAAIPVPPQPLFTTQPSFSVVPGAAQFFSLQNTYFALKQNQVSNALTLQAFDGCGNPGTAGANTTVLLSAETTGYNFATNPPTPIDDNSGAFGFALSTAGPFVRQLAIPIAAGASNAVFYASGTSLGVENIALSFTLGAPTTIYAGVTVFPSNVLTNVSATVDPTQVGTTLASIYPGGDPSTPQQAFINFDLYNSAGALDTGGQQGWHVLISSIPFRSGLATAIWEAWGTGTPSRGQIAWDGRSSPWINNGSRVPNGKYFIRLEVGAGIKDETLVVRVLTPEIVGTVSDGNSNPSFPLSGVTVRALGTSGGGAAQTDGKGRFVVPGIAAGTYQVTIQKAGYLLGQANVAIDALGNVLAPAAPVANVAVSTSTNGVLATLNAQIFRAPTLVVTPTILSTSSADQWGALQVQNPGLTVSLNTGIHLPAGQTVFDDGGQWDPSVSSFVTHASFTFSVPADTYTVTATFPGFLSVSTSVYAAPGITSFALPPFVALSSAAGSVFLAPTFSNANGVYVTIGAVPTQATIAKSSGAAQPGFTSVYLPPTVLASSYVLTGLANGQFSMQANAADAKTGQGYGAVQRGQIAVNGASLSGIDFPVFPDPNLTNLIIGTVTMVCAANDNCIQNLQPLGPGQPYLRLHASAWAPNSPNFGSAVAAISTFTATSASGTFTITGLSAATPVYQVFAYVERNSTGDFTAAGSLPVPVTLSGTGVGSVALSFVESQGVVSGTIILSSHDFSNVGMFGTTVDSPRPEQIGKTFRVDVATTLPNFSCADGNNGVLASLGACPTTNSATFRVTGLNTETDDITFLYKTTGQTRKIHAPIVNGSAFSATVDLSAQSYGIAGSIINQVSTPTYNNNSKIVANAPTVNLVDANFATNGVAYATTTARVIAAQQDATNFNVAVSTVYRPAVDRFAYLDQAGNFNIQGVPPGIYFVHTEDLRNPATLDVVVPRVGQLVQVGTFNVTGISLTLTDGYSVSGALTLDNSLQDARNLRLSVLNRRQEVVRSTTVILGDGGAGVLTANSVNYSFRNLPAGQFYTLTLTDLGTPAKYVAKPIKFPDPSSAPAGLQANMTGQNMLLTPGAFIIGRLKDANTGAQITAFNAGLLAPNFHITATADPWVEGGFVVAASSISGRPIQGDGTFRVGPLYPNVSYDLSLVQDKWDLAFLGGGSQNYAPVLLSGLTPTPGQNLDVGVLALSQGQSIKGTVNEYQTGTALGNIKISATPSFGDQAGKVFVQTFSDPQGNFSLWVSTFLASRFDVTAAPRDGNQASNGKTYAKVTQTLNVATTTPVAFVLSPLLGQVNGQVTTADGLAMGYPFGALKGFPAAAVFLQPSGVPTSPDSPLGSVQAQTDALGNFSVVGLSTGPYVLRVASLGYRLLAATATVSLDSSGSPVSCIFQGAGGSGCLTTLVLSRGATVTGRILKTDPNSLSGFSAVNQSEVGGVVAVNQDLTKFVFGAVEVDPNAKTLNSYTLSGFDSGTGDVYTLALQSQSEDDLFFPTEGSTVTFAASEAAATKNINLTFVSSGPVCVATQKQVGTFTSPQFLIKITCNKDLRNKRSSDIDLAAILIPSVVNSTGTALVSPDGTGSIGGPTNGDKPVSDNRKVITALYTPALNETQFSLRLKAFASNINPGTGVEWPIDQIFDFYVGLENNRQGSISNLSGGGSQMEPTSDDDANGVQEATRVDFDAGSFKRDSSYCNKGFNCSKPLGFVSVNLQRSHDPNQVTSQALRTLGYVPETVRTRTSSRALPAELSAAMDSYHALATGGGGIPPAFSAFYRVFLPQGILDQLNKLSRVSLSYNLGSSTGTPPNVGDLNVWHFTSAAVCPSGLPPKRTAALKNPGGWCLENRGRQLDVVNKTISVNVDSFSTFVVFASTPLFQLKGFTGSDIIAFNFPNPADCIAHTVQINGNNGFGTNSVNIQGTMIRTALPPGPGAQPLQIKIYNAAGELVRTIDQGTVTDGTFNYTPWDCSNDSGHTVASGVYFGVVKWANMSKVFKIAIIKGSGL